MRRGHRQICVFAGVLLAVLALFGQTASAAGKKAAFKTHTVYRGQTLGRIAKRYNVSIAALCTANGIQRRSAIKPGQKLVVPPASDKTGETTRAAVTGRKPKSSAKSAAKKASSKKTKTAPARKKKAVWKKYVRPARRKGYIQLQATGRRWRGYAIVKGNKISARALKGFKRTLYSWRTGTEVDIDPKLIRLLTEVSDKFGGRTLKVASGYREHSHSKASKHKLGRACDFTIVGVPNEALKEYLLTLPGVGVGYYPNSSFVHLDIRPVKTQWVDLARPGQAPIYTHKRTSARR